MSHLRAALGLALLVGTGWLWAGEGGKRPTPPDAYSAVWPDENPLAKPGAKVPVPPIIWEKIKVRADHPRLLFSKETLPALRERLRGNPLWTTIKDAAAQGDPLACAFLHQIGGNPKYAEYAINVLLTATPARDAAFLYDWTYDAMTEQQKRDATERVWETCVALDRTTGWPRCSPYTAYPTDSRPSETAPADWPPYYNWTFHDQDWARHYAITFFGLVALAGHKARCEEGVRNFWEYSLKDPVLFFDYLRDGSYWQGDYWSPTARIQEIYRIYQTMKTACGVDAIDPKTHPWLGNFGRWLLYCSDTGKGLSDPGKGRVIFNYGDSIMQPLQTRQKTCLYASNSLVNNPHVEWLAQNSVPEPVFWLDEALYHDTKFKGTPPDNLPRSRGEGRTAGERVSFSSEVEAWRWCISREGLGYRLQEILTVTSPLAGSVNLRWLVESAFATFAPLPSTVIAEISAGSSSKTVWALPERRLASSASGFHCSRRTSIWPRHRTPSIVPVGQALGSAGRSWILPGSDATSILMMTEGMPPLMSMLKSER